MKKFFNHPTVHLVLGAMVAAFLVTLATNTVTMTFSSDAWWYWLCATLGLGLVLGYPFIPTKKPQ